MHHSSYSGLEMICCFLFLPNQNSKLEIRIPFLIWYSYFCGIVIAICLFKKR